MATVWADCVFIPFKIPYVIPSFIHPTHSLKRRVIHLNILNHVLSQLADVHWPPLEVGGQEADIPINVLSNEEPLRGSIWFSRDKNAHAITN